MKKILFLALCSLALTLTCLAKTYTADCIPPETIEYTLAEYEDSLKCQLFIEEDGLFGLKVVSMNTSTEYEPKITVTLSKKGKELASFTTKNDDFFDYEYFMLEGLAEGEYTLKIENAAKFSDTSFVIDTFFTPWENIESQDNKSFEKASKMELGSRYKGGVMYRDEPDYFSFEMTEDGYAVIDLYSDSLKWFSLYDSEYNLIGSMDVWIDDENTVFETRCGLEKGTYFISVSPDEDYLSPRYALEVRAFGDAVFEKEYNNTHLTATPIKTSGVSGEIRGNLFGADDVDVYSFSLDKEASVTAKITDLYLTDEGHYEFSILEADGTPIITRTRCNTYSFENIELEKGDYYLSVSCPDERIFTAFGYKVRVQAETQAENTDKEDTATEDTEPVAPKPSDFADISPDAWYAKDIAQAREMGLIEGTGNNKFQPDGNVTVAEAVTMAARMYEKLSGAKIADVDGEKWYTSYVLYAVAAGIINTDDFEDFEASATRAEMAYIFAGVLKNAELPAILAHEIDIPDVDINHKYFNPIQLLYKLDILTGVDDSGTFLPDNSVTRAESAVIMLRVAKLLAIK